MPSASDRSPPSVSTSSPGRRILSKITAPFANAPRTIAEFSVTVDDGVKQYSPGDLVTGNVTLRVTRPTRITHLVVCLQGFVQVYKNPGSPAEGQRQSGGRNGRVGDHFGSGFAPLFEDEVVLCGDGKLTEGTFRFQFELEFPDSNLPSSIDFERGTITYMVTASLTRPTTISPILTCERKVYFVERIDISHINSPKARTITLEPVHKRSRARHPTRAMTDTSDKFGRNANSSRQSSNARTASRTPSVPSTHNDVGVPDSPVRSDISFDSALTNAQASQADSQRRVSSPGSDSGAMNSSKISLTSKIITATIEPETGGYLRGDNITVKINVSHTKQIKSLYGVILTLYRQARVDMHPSTPVGPTEKGNSRRHDDYYPKSRTGLGGLSLSGAGSNHVFRKDLSQSLMPLFVDPQTLTAEVTARVRVPEDAFPTISTVPGGMISFRYYVEAVLDIQGKLTGQDRGLGAASSAMPEMVVFSDASSVERSAAAPFGSTIIDTAAVRRENSVVTCTFEIVIGTKDSKRRRGKTKAATPPAPEPTQQASPSPAPLSQGPASVQGRDAGTVTEGATNHQYQGPEGDYYYDYDYNDPRWYNGWYYYGDGSTEGTYDGWHSYQEHSSQAQDLAPRGPPPVPVPQLPDESQMTEKERMRHAEARLLPSDPNDLEVAGPSANGLQDASAPYLPDVEEYPQSEDVPSASGYAANTASGSRSSRPEQPSTHHRQPSIPQYEPPGTASSSQTAVPFGDDKQELQRRQLQAEASAPPIDEGERIEDEHAAAGVLSASHEAQPSAPTFDQAEADGGTHDSHADAPASSDLPRYER